MNTLSNLREAFSVFVILAFIGLVNAAQLWERQRNPVQLTNIELTESLKLELGQLEKIRAINLAYESEISQLRDDDIETANKKRNQLLRLRNKQVVEILTDQQKNILYGYCTNLMWFTTIGE